MGEDRENFRCEGRVIGRAWTFHKFRSANPARPMSAWGQTGCTPGVSFRLTDARQSDRTTRQNLCAEVLTVAAHQGGCGGPGRQIELEQNVGDVPLHRMIAKPQLFGDPGIPEPAGDELEHLAFSLAQYFQSGRSCGTSVRLKMRLGHDGKEAQPATPS